MLTTSTKRRPWRRIAIVSACTLGVLAMIGGGGFAYFMAYGYSLPPDAPPAPAATRDGRWVQDIDYLAKELPRLHRDGLVGVSASDFDRARATLDARVPSLSDGEIEVGIEGLTALLGDAHTTANPSSLQFFPIRLEWFPDGIRAISAPKAHAEVMGMRLVAIDGVGADDSFKRLAAVIPHQNQPWLWALVPRAMVTAEYLHYAGITGSLYSATFSFSDGSNEISLPLRAGAEADQDREATTLSHLTLQETDARDAFWYSALGGGVLYVLYNQCADSQQLDAFKAQLPGLLAHARTVVIDLRNNSGGNSMVFAPVLDQLTTWSSAHPRHLVEIVGRYTFSSAVINALDLKLKAEATVIGEPTGGTPDSYGEVRTLTLTNSGEHVQYSTIFESDYPSLVGKTSLEPDRLVQPTITDVLGGVDPALAAAQAD